MEKSGSAKTAILLCVNIAALIILLSVIFIKPQTDTQKEIPSADEPVRPAVSASEPAPDAPEKASPEHITLSIYSEYITAGASLKIEAAVSPSDSSTVTWTSADSSIASVAQDGTVTGVAKGCTDIIASTPNGGCAVQTIYVMNPGLVYLSPSRQTGNIYFDRTTDECEQAFLMSGFCKQRLEAVGLEVHECPIKYDLEYRGKLAAEMNAKCYVAIHTNAGGNEQGTMSFFNRRSEASIRLANAVYETVSVITPDPDSGVKNGVKSNGKTYKEIQYPYEAGVPSTLLEVDYHDKEASARWLKENSEPIGIAIADGIMRFMYENY